MHKATLSQPTDQPNRHLHHPRTTAKPLTPLRTRQVRGEGPIPRDVDRPSPSDHEAARGRERVRATLVVCEDDTFPAKSPGAGHGWRARSFGCRTALVSTARSLPALRLAVASGVDLAAAIDAFLSQPEGGALTP